MLQTNDRLKWYILGFLSALAAVSVAVVVLIYVMTPLVKIDESTGRVQLLGGFIDVQARDVITQLSKEGSFVFGTIEGVENLSESTKLIYIKFGAGEVRIDFNEGSEMNWDCDGAGKNTKIEKSPDGQSITLDFTSAFVDCDINIPIKSVKIEGVSGEVEVRKIKADLDIKLTSGQLLLDPMPEQHYIYDLKVESGVVDEALKSQEPVALKSGKPAAAIKVKAEIKLGSIDLLD